MRERRTSSNGSSVWWTTVDRASAAVAAVRRSGSSVTESRRIDPSFIALAMVRNLRDRMALTAAVSFCFFAINRKNLSSLSFSTFFNGTVTSKSQASRRRDVHVRVLLPKISEPIPMTSILEQTKEWRVR